MAKKKLAEEISISSTELVDKVYSELEKEFGPVIKSGSDVIDNKKITIPVSPTIDIISGRWEEGSCIGLAGPEKSGKTTTALTFARNCQTPEFGERPIFYGDVECRLSERNLQGIKGLKTERPYFNRIGSEKGKILSSQDHLRIYCKILQTVPNAVLIIDSISALVDSRELDEGVGKETRGGGAKIFTQFVNLISNVVPVNNCIIIGMAHLIANTSGYGPAQVEKSAARWKYQCDYQLRSSKAKHWLVGEKVIGIKTDWVCHTSKTGPPGLSCTSLIRFGVGLDRLSELINLAVDVNIIKQSGAWYQLTFLGDDSPKLQGENGVYNALIEHPEWANTLETQLRKLSGIC